MDTALSLSQLVPLVLLAALMWMVAASIRVYAAIRAEDRAATTAIPQHVPRVGAAYLAALLYTAADVASHLNDGRLFTWQLSAGLVVALLGLWATWSVLGYERTRLRGLRATTATQRAVQDLLRRRRPPEA